jgi:hypothetical protein
VCPRERAGLGKETPEHLAMELDPKLQAHHWSLTMCPELQISGMTCCLLLYAREEVKCRKQKGNYR